jgi:hypothetical protein
MKDLPVHATIPASDLDRDIQGAVSALQDKDVVFEEYDFPGLKTENGIARPGPGRVVQGLRRERPGDRPARLS